MSSIVGSKVSKRGSIEVGVQKKLHDCRNERAFLSPIPREEYIIELNCIYNRLFVPRACEKFIIKISIRYCEAHLS